MFDWQELAEHFLETCCELYGVHDTAGWLLKSGYSRAQLEIMGFSEEDYKEVFDELVAAGEDIR